MADESDPRPVIEKQIAPYSVILTQIYLWTFITFTAYWIRRSGQLATKLEMSAKVSVIGFSIVIPLQAAYEIVTLAYSLNSN